MGRMAYARVTDGHRSPAPGALTAPGAPGARGDDAPWRAGRHGRILGARPREPWSMAAGVVRPVRGPFGASGVMRNVVVRVALYYAALLGGAALLWPWITAVGLGLPARVGAADALRDLAGQGAAADAAATPATAVTLAPTVLLAMAGALLLALPVAWVYVLTRAKRGYQQSVVQMLVALPLVVAGVVVLVKDSLALAFGLAGIVAAVRFRTALDDSKDAVYVFLATGIGLASAVDLPVAAVLSVLFNAVILVFWSTDFGRTPAHLDGRLAERRLQRTIEQLSRTGTFVARMDSEIFQDMSAEQLQAVADRAWRRARRNNPELPDASRRGESLLRIRTYDVEQSRDAVEPLLEAHLKRWRFGGVVREPDGTSVVEYVVLLRKSGTPAVLLETLQAEAAPHVVGAELD